MKKPETFAVLNGEERAKIVPVATPDWMAPMKAVLTERRFSDDDWIYERKLDGIRCLAFKEGGGVRLLSRNKLSLDLRFSEIRSALLEATKLDCVLDGGVVAMAGGQ